MSPWRHGRALVRSRRSRAGTGRTGTVHATLRSPLRHFGTLDPPAAASSCQGYGVDPPTGQEHGARAPRSLPHGRTTPPSAPDGTGGNPPAGGDTCQVTPASGAGYRQEAIACRYLL